MTSPKYDEIKNKHLKLGGRWFNAFNLLYMLYCLGLDIKRNENVDFGTSENIGNKVLDYFVIPCQRYQDIGRILPYSKINLMVGVSSTGLNS